MMRALTPQQEQHRARKAAMIKIITEGPGLTTQQIMAALHHYKNRSFTLAINAVEADLLRLMRDQKIHRKIIRVPTVRRTGPGAKNLAHWFVGKENENE